jgi:hypothetical protein
MIFPKSIKVKCTIALSNYEKVSANQFSLQVDISKGKNGIATIQKIKVPSFLELVKYETLTVNYFVVKENE